MSIVCNWKRALLLCAFALILLLPVSAMAKTVQVGTLQQFEAAMAEAQQLADAAIANGDQPEWYTMQLTADIQLGTKVKYYQLQNGAKLRLESAPGRQYTIRCSDDAADRLEYIFMLSNNVSFSMENVILDGNGSEHQDAGFVHGNIDCDLYFGKGAVFQHSGGVVPVCVTRNSKATVDGASFLNNNGMYGNYRLPRSGVLYAFVSSELIVYDALFDGNQGHHAGAAITIQGDSKLTLYNGTFINNTSMGGSAVFAWVRSRVEIHGGTFMYNHGVGNEYRSWPEEFGNLRGEGGTAIMLWGQSNGFVKNAVITHNECDLAGGAITVFNGSELEIDNCIITDNVALTHGGGVVVCDRFSKDASYRSRVTITNTRIADNVAHGFYSSDTHCGDPYAPGGGGIFVHENCELILGEGTVIENNRALGAWGDGGGVHVSYGGKVDHEGAIIRSNHAQRDGGGVFVEGAGKYMGWDHPTTELTPGAPDDGYGAYTIWRMKDGAVVQNTAGRNGGGVFVSGRNIIELDGVTYVYDGGTLQMTGGVITENKAMDMGGGVYVGAAQQGERGGALEMTGGAIYLNVAGEVGNTSPGADDAGADVYSEGGNAQMSVVGADAVTAYVRDLRNKAVPPHHRRVYFTNWYDDYSDQDPDYGKAPEKIGTGVNTGRYKSSRQPDRMVYAPLPKDGEYNALILDYELPGLPRTGDDTPLWVYAALAAMSLAVICAVALQLRKRSKQ